MLYSFYQVSTSVAVSANTVLPRLVVPLKVGQIPTARILSVIFAPSSRIPATSRPDKSFTFPAEIDCVRELKRYKTAAWRPLFYYHSIIRQDAASIATYFEKAEDGARFYDRSEALA